MIQFQDFPSGAADENLPVNAGTRVCSLVQEDSKCVRVTKPIRHNTEHTL